VSPAPLRDADALARLDQTIGMWAAQWRDSGMVGHVEHHDQADERGHHHWLIRLRGEEKDVITIWLSLRQRTVHVETEVMPAPEANREALYHYLLVKNAGLRMLHVAIGPEQGIYLVGSVPVGELDVERLDELVGASITYVDELFPTAMAMGVPALYRRRPLRP
jgi:hypothetical protein